MLLCTVPCNHPKTKKKKKTGGDRLSSRPGYYTFVEAVEDRCCVVLSVRTGIDARSDVGVEDKMKSLPSTYERRRLSIVDSDHARPGYLGAECHGYLGTSCVKGT